MINFPDSPTPGMVFNPGTGPIYTWDGVAWNLTPVNVKTARPRNHVVNGSMWVGQENGTGVVSTNNSHLADNWVMQFNGLAAQGALTNTAPLSPDNNTWGIVTNVGTAKPSLAASDYVFITHPVEGVEMVDFRWGFAGGIPVVLRFNAYCDTPGLYTVCLRNAANDRSYLKGVNLTASWQTFVLAIPPDLTGTWAGLTTNMGLQISLVGATGSTFHGVEGWQAGNKLGLATQANLAAVALKNIAITDVGLYADPDRTGLPPLWEAPEYADEIRRCYRYYQQQSVVEMILTSPGNIQPLSALPVAMRTPPTLVNVGGDSTWSAAGPVFIRQGTAATAFRSVTLKLSARLI